MVDTRSEARKMEEFAQAMQGSWTEFQKEMQSQMLKHQEQQERSINGLRELISEMNLQVMQLINNPIELGGARVSRTIPEYTQPCNYQKEMEQNGQAWRSPNQITEPKGKTIPLSSISVIDNPLAELVTLKQCGDIQQYWEQFSSLLARVELAESESIGCFLKGLKDEIQQSVRIFKPPTLYGAFCVAKLQEATLASITKEPKLTLAESSQPQKTRILDDLDMVKRDTKVESTDQEANLHQGETTDHSVQHSLDPQAIGNVLTGSQPMVLTTRFWPSYKTYDLNLPTEMLRCVEVFGQFYQTKTEHRKLTWVYSLGNCNLNGMFGSKTIELAAGTYQFAARMLFKTVESMIFLVVWCIKDHTTSIFEVAIMIFDPGGKTVKQSLKDIARRFSDFNA